MEILGRQRPQLHAKGKSALELRHEIGRLGEMERAGGDKQDVVGFHHAVLGVDHAALDHGEQVALHALAGHVRPLAAALPAADFVDLINKDDAGLLHALLGRFRDLVHVHQAVGLLLQDHVVGFTYPHGLGLLALGKGLGKEVLELAAHFFHARHGHDLHLGRGHGHLHGDHAVVELAFAPELAQLVAGGQPWLAGRLGRGFNGGRHGDGAVGRALGFGQEQIEQAFLGGFFGFDPHPLQLFLAHEVDADLHEVAHHGFHVASDIADLGELGGLDLEKGRAGQAGQPPSDLGLAHARGADHDDVFGRDLVAQDRLDLLATPAVAHGDGHHALGVALADDVFVEFRNDFTRRQAGVHGYSLLWRPR